MTTTLTYPHQGRFALSPHGIRVLLALLGITTGFAAPSAPGWISRGASSQPGNVDVSWESVTDADFYAVKRGASPTDAMTTLGTTSNSTFTDTTAMLGQRYYYSIIANNGTDESPPTRAIAASPSVIVDNGELETTSTGIWQASTVAGSYGLSSLFAAPVVGSVPTATFTYTPNLPARGDYDVYMRWTAHNNRATNTPVEFIYPDGRTSFRINQRINHATWVLIGSVTVETGATPSVVIGNHGADGNVVADAIQFVPRHHPWGPESDRLADYTVVPLEDDFDGSSIDPNRWKTFAGRSEYSVSDGRLHTRLRYRGSVPLASASSADLENEANWIEGGIIAREAQKFGFHEARLRVPQLPARGVDTAYWHSATDELLNGYEIDAPEIFNKDSSGAANNFGFGVWDHIDGARTWDYTRNYSTIGAKDQFVTIGLEWRTDNRQVVYINGKKVFTAPAAGMNDTESILPSNVILSTKVLKWLRPNAALDGAEALWDYARYYQKPGFLGAIDAEWSKPENWGPDGLPGPGKAAVFNLANAPTHVTLSSDQNLQSLFLDQASLPAHVFTGSGKLRLGVGNSSDPSVTHGGVLVNTAVSMPQSINVPIIGHAHLQFANLSRTLGHVLALNGQIAGDGLAPRDVDFVTSMGAVPNLGTIVLGQALGPGIRHINKAGDSNFHLPSNNQHSGELRIARGSVSMDTLSALGINPDSAIVFRARYKHSEPWRPRLVYLGAGESSTRELVIGGWQADAILESSGTGPLVWSGNTRIAPSADNPKQVLTRDITFTLSGTASSGVNVFSGALSDTGVVVSYLNSDGSLNSAPAVLRFAKTGSGTWRLTGNNTYSGSTTVSAGSLIVDGSITGSGLLTVAAGSANLSGNGFIHSPSQVNGTLTATPLTFSQSLTLGSTAKLQTRFTSSSSSGISSINASEVIFSNGSQVDVILNGPGSTTHFPHNYWRSPQVIPLISASTMTGTLAMGTVSGDAAGNPVTNFGSFSLLQSANTVSLLWTPIPGYPDIHAPTITRLTPSTHPISLTDTETQLQVAVTTSPETNVVWSCLSGPGTATFTHPNNHTSQVIFSHAGTYVVQATASNVLGSASTEWTVYVAPPTTMLLRQEENNTHPTTFIRGDNPTWNSGARDQILVGRTSAPMRSLLAFDLSSIPQGANINQVELQLTSASIGYGSQLNTLRVHEMLVPFLEGSGNGSAATHGVGTGADWLRRTETLAWSSPGTSASTDYVATPLVSVAGFNPSTFSPGTALMFSSTAAFVAAANAAIQQNKPLTLLLRMDADTAGSSNYLRLASNDHTNLSYRPRLSLSLGYQAVPSITLGTIAPPVFGAPVILPGSVTDASQSSWSQLSGPANVQFENAASPTTSANFPIAGYYALALSATNTIGESRRVIGIQVVSRLQAWRHRHFGTTDNSGDASDNADPDRDGLANVLEFATGNLPASPDAAITTLTKSGSLLEFTYRRSHAAVDAGINFTVEWSANLSDDWSTSGVIQSAVPDSNNGDSSLWKATLPAGTHQRFLRLKTTIPPS